VKSPFFTEKKEKTGVTFMEERSANTTGRKKDSLLTMILSEGGSSKGTFDRGSLPVSNSRGPYYLLIGKGGLTYLVGSKDNRSFWCVGGRDLLILEGRRKGGRTRRV